MQRKMLRNDLVEAAEKMMELEEKVRDGGREGGAKRSDSKSNIEHSARRFAPRLCLTSLSLVSLPPSPSPSPTSS